MELVKNHITHTHTSVATGYTTLRFRAELYVETTFMSGTFTKVNTQVHTADVNKQSTFYLEAILRSYLDYDNPAADLYFLADMTKSIRRYRVDITEIVDSVAGSVGTGTVKYVMLAGKTLRNFNETITRPSFTAAGNHTYLFLTTRQLSRKMHWMQNEYMYILPLQNITSAQLTVLITYTDATTHSEPIALGNLAQYEGIIMRLADDYLDLNSYNPTKTIQHIELYINASSTERIKYQMYEPYTDNQVTLYYANSLGGFDSLICEGATMDKVMYTKQLVNKLSTAAFSLPDGDMLYNDPVITRKLELSSGYKSKADVMALRDLAVSGKVLMRDGDDFVPFVITNTDGPDWSDEDQTWYFRFEGHLEYREKAFDRVI